MADKYDISYYSDFLMNLKKEYNSSNDVCDVFNVGIKHYVDKINDKVGILSNSDWKEIAKVAKSNTPDAKHLAIFMIENVVCPTEIVRDFEDTSMDEDILLACLSSELDAKRIAYLINSISEDRMKRIAFACQIRQEAPMFTRVALDILATDFSDKFEDKFLLFAHNRELVEKMEENNLGLTERQATYIIQNPYFSTQFKDRIYKEYGFDVTQVNENVPEHICEDIFRSAFQTAFEIEDVSDDLKREAEKVIHKLQEEKLLSDFAQSELANVYNSKKDISAVIRETVSDIALTTKSGITHGLLTHPLKYRNPIVTQSCLSIAIIEGIETMSNALTDSIYKETADFVADKIVYQNNLREKDLKFLYDHIKSENKNKKEMLTSVILSIVSNTNISKNWRDKFSKLYKKNAYISAINNLNTKLQENGFTEKEIKYIMESILRKNTYIRKDIEEKNPDVYLTEAKFKDLENIIKGYDETLTPEAGLNIRRGLSLIAFERSSLKFFMENRVLFSPAEDYNLRYGDKHNKTINILRLDRKNDEELHQIYEQMSHRDLQTYRNWIYSAVSYQPKKCNLYLWLDKYVRQYNIVNEVIREKERELENTKNNERVANNDIDR